MITVVVSSLVGCALLVAGLKLAPSALGWVLGTREPTARSEGVTQRVLPIQSLATTLSPDGRTLAVRSAIDTVELWDVGSGTVRQVLRVAVGGRSPVLDEVVFAPDGSTFAMLPPGGETIQIWDADTNTAHTPIQVPATGSGLNPLRASDLLYSPDGHTVATTGDCLCLWDVATGALLHRIDVPVQGAAFAPDGKTIAGAASNRAGVWDVATGAAVQSFSLSAEGEYPGGFGWEVRFSPDGRTVVTDGSKIRAWDPETGKRKWLSNILSSNLSFSLDGSLLAVADQDAVWLIDPATGARVRKLPGLAGLLIAVGNNQQVWQLAWAPDSRTLAVSHRGGFGKWSRTPQIWDVRTGTAVQVLKGHTDDVRFLSYAPDGRTVITVSIDKSARIWQAP